MKGFSDVLLSLLSFQGPHTSGNLESRNKIRSFSNKQTGSQVHAWDDNYNNRSRIKTFRDDDKRCWFATLQKQCGFSNQKRAENRRPARVPPARHGNVRFYPY